MMIADEVVVHGNLMMKTMVLEVTAVSSDAVHLCMVSDPLHPLCLRVDLSCVCSNRLRTYRQGISEYCNPIADLSSVSLQSTSDS